MAGKDRGKDFNISTSSEIKGIALYSVFESEAGI
jgi:hypothetical protein